MKPDDIPQDIWDAALNAPLGETEDMDLDISLAIARAIIAERLRCKEIANSYRTNKAGEFWKGWDECAEDIERLIESGDS